MTDQGEDKAVTAPDTTSISDKAASSPPKLKDKTIEEIEAIFLERDRLKERVQELEGQLSDLRIRHTERLMEARQWKEKAERQAPPRKRPEENEEVVKAYR